MCFFGHIMAGRGNFRIDLHQTGIEQLGYQTAMRGLHDETAECGPFRLKLTQSMCGTETDLESAIILRRRRRNRHGLEIPLIRG